MRLSLASLLVLAVAVGACRKEDPTPAPGPQLGTTGNVVTAAAAADAGGAGSGADAVILPLNYPVEATDAPSWTKVLVREETIEGEKRLVAVGWAKGIQSDSLAHSAATMQARTRLLRVTQGQSADSTQPIEGELTDTRVEETFRSKNGTLFVKISGPAK